jgi:4-hydroxybenzoate polyprenyltransferase
MKNKEINRLVKSVIFVNSIIMLIGVVVLLILRKYSWTFGYLLGSVTADITFIMHANNVSKVGITNTNPTKSSISSSIFRMLISAMSLLIAFLIEGIDIYATFVGLVLIKVVIIIVSFVVEKKNSKEYKGGDS